MRRKGEEMGCTLILPKFEKLLIRQKVHIIRSIDSLRDPVDLVRNWSTSAKLGVVFYVIHPSKIHKTELITSKEPEGIGRTSSSRYVAY